MSRPTTMLRTRRRDNNVKPNRRLDRKSSRGMIYENEELRLRTININAEVERGQSDIKKLRRENEMLKKEIWCLRDGYDKLEKLIKEKGIESSSSSTTGSSSESETSCSSCTEEPEEVETSQNLENVQKTNIKNLHAHFNQLSVVPEENSAENSEKNSNRASLPNETTCLAASPEPDVIKPDQSYPNFNHNDIMSPRNFFSPISRSYDDCLNNEFICDDVPDFPNYQQTAQHFRGSETSPQQNLGPESYYQNMMQTMDKTNSDVIVKMDNCHFNATTPSQSTFSNGGNLEELLNDIETISQDILKISNDPNLLCKGTQNYHTGCQEFVTFQQPHPTHIANIEPETITTDENRPYKSELNVVLMPTPMPLIGFEKYKHIHDSNQSIDQSMSASCQNLMILLNNKERGSSFRPTELFGQNHCREVLREGERVGLDSLPPPVLEQTNPFFFGQLPEVFGKGCEEKSDVSNSKSNLVEVGKEGEDASTPLEDTKINDEKKPPEPKSPKLSIRRKVSIHFKGKKDKPKKPLFDLKFRTKSPKSPKNPNNSPKKTDIDPKKSEPETKKLSPATEVKTDRTMSLPNYTTKPPDPKVLEKKIRKSISVSPDRKHVHMKEEGAKKSHKKHKRGRTRRSSASTDRFLRERSFSVCTDRSNVLDYRLGLGFGSGFLYDEGSDSRSLSSCETVKTRKMSNMSNIPMSGKIPWCGCWGNGCV